MNTLITAPQRAKLVFRVGIVGTGDEWLDAPPGQRFFAASEDLLGRIRTEIERFGRENDQLFAAAPPCVRAVSTLTRESERIVAQAAIARDYELQCVLPRPLPSDDTHCSRRAFSAPAEGQIGGGASAPATQIDGPFTEVLDLDFAASNICVASVAVIEPEQEYSPPQSALGLAEFLALARSRDASLVTYELDGQGTDLDVEQPALNIVLNQSDVLILIEADNDGQECANDASMLRKALARQIPVILVRPGRPDAWRIVRALSEVEPRCDPGAGDGSLPTEHGEALREVIERSLLPPEHLHPLVDGADLRTMFFAERQPRLNWPIWKFLRDVIGRGVLRTAPVTVADIENGQDDSWPLDRPGCQGRVNRALYRHFRWPDVLADYYAHRYRSGFVTAYLLAAAAVAFALLPLIAPKYTTAYIVAEFVMIAGIVFIVLRGRHCLLHERWMDYRLLAELVRQVRFVVPLGGGHARPQWLAHLGTYGDPAATWMFWHVRNIEREIGLPDARVDGAFLADYLDSLERGLLVDQRDFHADNARCSHNIDHRLHVLAITFMFLTLGVCLWHLLCACQSATERHGLEILAAVFPACGAALAGIRNQGEFLRIAKRSAAMRTRFGELLSDVRKLRSGGARLASGAVAALAVRAAQLMVDEVQDWRVVFVDRPLETPS